MTAALIATLATPPEPREHLERFAHRVRPPGCWRGLGPGSPKQAVRWLIKAWVMGNAAVFGITFGVGSMLFGHPVSGTVTALCGALAIWLTLASTARAREHLDVERGLSASD